MLTFYVKRRNGWDMLVDAETIEWLKQCDKQVNSTERTQRFSRDEPLWHAPGMYVTLYEVNLFQGNGRVHTRVVEMADGERCELVRTYRERVPTRNGYWRPGF